MHKLPSATIGHATADTTFFGLQATEGDIATGLFMSVYTLIARQSGLLARPSNAERYELHLSSKSALHRRSLIRRHGRQGQARCQPVEAG
jgi:hypothetical protein